MQHFRLPKLNGYIWGCKEMKDIVFILEEKHSNIAKYGIEIKILLKKILILNQFTMINI